MAHRALDGRLEPIAGSGQPLTHEARAAAEATSKAQGKPIDGAPHFALVQHRQFRRVRRGGGTHVGHEVAERDVVLVANCRDGGHLHGGEGAANPLVVEGAQVLARASPSPHDADIGVETVDEPERPHQFAHRVVALYPCTNDQNSDGGPASLCHRDDVMQCRPLHAGHHRQCRGVPRQRSLA